MPRWKLHMKLIDLRLLHEKMVQKSGTMIVARKVDFEVHN